MRPPEVVPLKASPPTKLLALPTRPIQIELEPLPPPAHGGQVPLVRLPRVNHCTKLVPGYDVGLIHSDIEMPLAKFEENAALVSRWKWSPFAELPWPRRLSALPMAPSWIMPATGADA